MSIAMTRVENIGISKFDVWQGATRSAQSCLVLLLRKFPCASRSLHHSTYIGSWGHSTYLPRPACRELCKVGISRCHGPTFDTAADAGLELVGRGSNYCSTSLQPSNSTSISMHTYGFVNEPPSLVELTKSRACRLSIENLAN